MIPLILGISVAPSTARQSAFIADAKLATLVDEI
jgi:hypothetical protein